MAAAEQRPRESLEGYQRNTPRILRVHDFISRDPPQEHRGDAGFEVSGAGHSSGHHSSRMSVKALKAPTPSGSNDPAHRALSCAAHRAHRALSCAALCDLAQLPNKPHWFGSRVFEPRAQITLPRALTDAKHAANTGRAVHGGRGAEAGWSQGPSYRASGRGGRCRRICAAHDKCRNGQGRRKQYSRFGPQSHSGSPHPTPEEHLAMLCNHGTQHLEALLPP